MTGPVLFVVLALAGCAKRDDDFTPQIRVVPGAAARALWIPSHRPPPPASPPVTEAPQKGAPATLTVSDVAGQGDR